MLITNIYIIEDNIRYRMDLKNYIIDYLNEHTLISQFNVLAIQNYPRFFEELPRYHIKDSDIFIIDINLSTYFSGVELGKEIRKSNQKCNITYLTSSTDRAIDIINQQISPDAYLVKSNDLEITKMQLTDLFSYFSINTPETGKSIVVQSNSVRFILNLSDIVYISVLKGFRGKLNVQTNESTFTIDSSLSKIKKSLPSPPFYLGFKSIIINLQNIKTLSPLEQTIIFKNNIELYLNQKLIYKLIKFQKGIK